MSFKTHSPKSPKQLANAFTRELERLNPPLVDGEDFFDPFENLPDHEPDGELSQLKLLFAWTPPEHVGTLH